MYCKGEFKKMVFAKFATKRDRDNAIAILRQNKNSEQWIKPDRPLNERVVRSLVFGLKQFFSDWKWDVAGMWADENNGTFTIGKKTVVTVSIHYKNLVLEYGDDWETYLTDKSWPQWLALVDEQNAKLKLSKSSTTATKGVGKTNK